MTLSERESSILYAVVSEFISTGEPVGSRTLSTRYGLELSAASIRNVLSDLEDKGYLTQPHTSAGRVPTPLAFRLYIEALMRLRRLPKEDSERIAELFAVPMGSEARLREAGKLLSELSGSPALIVRTRGEVRKLSRIRFIQTKPLELLAVLVFEDSTVENRFITTESQVPVATLERLHTMLDEGTAPSEGTGRTLVELSEHLEKLATAQSDEIFSLGQLGGTLLSGALKSRDDSRDLIVEGTSTLISATEDPSRIRALIEALEDREQLLGLLERTATSSRVEVFLGGEDKGHAVPFNLVASGFGGGVSPLAGALGVLGSDRMDYPGVVPLVSAMARALGNEISRSSGKSESQAGDRGSIDPGPGGG